MAKPLDMNSKTAKNLVFHIGGDVYAAGRCFHLLHDKVGNRCHNVIVLKGDSWYIPCKNTK